jgi:hypothetical protein
MLRGIVGEVGACHTHDDGSEGRAHGAGSYETIMGTALIEHTVDTNVLRQVRCRVLVDGNISRQPSLLVLPRIVEYRD